MSVVLYELAGRDPDRPFSPHCWKTRLALMHKGIGFETRSIPFTRIPDIEGGSKIVPVLRDGNRVVSDSFEIAEYLDEAYPDAPSLFAGEGGRQLSRFVETWSSTTIHPAIAKFAIMDIFNLLGDEDRDYFRQSREAAFGRPLEEVQNRDEAAVQAFLASLMPLRGLLKRQPYLGGEAPLFADHIIFGAFQWLRVVSGFDPLPKEDPVAVWFDRCLELYDAHGRSVSKAA